MTLKIIIQARTGSTRFPRKMVVPFYKEKSILEILIQRIINKIDSTNIIVATSIKENDNDIEILCNKLEVKCFRGSEEDVLQRFIDAAKQNKANKIIRICADNIFLDISYLEQLMFNFNNEDVDYYSYQTICGKPSILTHYGLWAIEGVKIEALQRIALNTNDNYYHEHVTNFIYTHPQEFQIKYSTITSNIQNNKKIRLTIDTKQDFLIMQSIYSSIIESNMDITTENIINYLNDNQKYYELMEKIIISNNKE